MSSLEMELDAGEENLGDDILNLSTADIQARARLMDNEVPSEKQNIGTRSISGANYEVRAWANPA